MPVISNILSVNNYKLTIYNNVSSAAYIDNANRIGCCILIINKKIFVRSS